MISGTDLYVHAYCIEYRTTCINIEDRIKKHYYSHHLASNKENSPGHGLALLFLGILSVLFLSSVSEESYINPDVPAAIDFIATRGSVD